METLQKKLVEQPKAIVLVIHGSGEHIGRYDHVGDWLNKEKISMIGGDLPGLGRSKEIRGHINEFDDYLRKVDEWVQYARNMWNDVPLFILGHSLGGLIVLRYLQELENREVFRGAIVSSPAVSIGIDVPKWQLITAKMLEKFWPTFRLKSGIKPEQVSRDASIVNKYAKDPLVYSKVSIRWFFEFQKAIKLVWEKGDKLKQVNLLYMQAGADQLVDPKASEKFVTQLKNNKTEFHLIPNLYHEIFNEPEKEIYLTLMTDWINKQL